jgi:CBS domain containing-hemolysin-like protein
MWFQIVLMLVLLACSAILSASETALFALSRPKLREFRASRNPLRREAAALMQHPARVLSAVLIANTAINIGIFAVSIVLLSRATHLNPLLNAALRIATVGAVLVLGDLLPKVIALGLAEQLAPLVAPIVAVVQVALAPLRWVLTVFIIEPLTRLVSPPRAGGAALSVDELQTLVELSARRGLISSYENDMLQEVIALPGISVRSVMVPRVDIVAVSIDTPLEQVRDRMRAVRLTKLPVYGRDLDDIRGLVYAKDIYLQPGHDLPHLLRAVDYVPGQCNLVQLIGHFRERQTQLAIVVDEYGGVAGLVALEDVLEQIVGDIVSTEERSPEEATQRVDAETYRVSGDLSVRDLAEALSAALPESADLLSPAAGVETLGGLVVSLLGRLPRTGDAVRIGDLELKVDRMRGRRIDRLLLRRMAAKPTTAVEAEIGL